MAPVMRTELSAADNASIPLGSLFGSLQGNQVLLQTIALHQRVLYAESAAQGLAVFESGRGSDAAREILALADSIENQRRVAA